MSYLVCLDCGNVHQCEPLNGHTIPVEGANAPVYKLPLKEADDER